MSRTMRIQSMRSQLQRALSVPDNVQIQRDALHRISHDATIIGEPPVSWLLNELREIGAGHQVNSISPASYHCPSCHRQFPSQTALSGHGPHRCSTARKGGVIS